MINEETTGEEKLYLLGAPMPRYCAIELNTGIQLEFYEGYTRYGVTFDSSGSQKGENGKERNGARSSKHTLPLNVNWTYKALL